MWIHIPCTSCDVIRLASVKPCAQCRRTQQCWTTTPKIVECYTLRLFAHPAACCFAKFETSQTFTLTTPNISFVLSTPRRGANNVGSICTALPTLLGTRTRITHCLQSLMGCNLPTMHCRYKHCWALLHPLVQHSQHRWSNNVGSCCIPLHVA